MIFKGYSLFVTSELRKTLESSVNVRQKSQAFNHDCNGKHLLFGKYSAAC